MVGVLTVLLVIMEEGFIVVLLVVLVNNRDKYLLSQSLKPTPVAPRGRVSTSSMVNSEDYT